MDVIQESDQFVIGMHIKPYNWTMRQARLGKGLTQCQLAKLANVKVSVISKLELFQIGYSLSWDVLDRIADCLEQPTYRLFPQWLQSQIVRESLSGDLPIPLSKAIAIEGPDVLQGYIQEELMMALETALQKLDPRQRDVLQLRFGLNGKALTLEEISRKCGVTPERIRQLESQGLRRLRHPSCSNALYDALRTAV